MKQNQKGRRGRHRNQNRRSGGDGSRDGRKPPTRNRNQAKQQVDRYTTLAREALQAQDFVAAQNYYQHAEYYQRLLGEFEADKPQQAQSKAPQTAGGRPNGAKPSADQSSGKVIAIEAGEAGDEAAKDGDDEAISA